MKKIIKLQQSDVKQSKEWYDSITVKLKGFKPSDVMLNKEFPMKTYLTPGKPVFFYYDPKFKDSLPYYDQFPLVLPYDKTNDQFIGLNLHYLDYKPRMILFQELLKISGANHLSERSKINYSWEMIRNASKIRGVGGCIKRYLISHVQQPFCEIKPEFWHTAVMLPVQRFVGASKEAIWRESIRK